MKKFIVKLLLIFIPVLLFSFGFDYLITKTLRKSKAKNYVVWNDLVQGKINSKILIYGTSRARAHVNSKILEDSLHSSVYNLGIDGYTFKMQYCRHKLVLKNNNVPNYIIQTLDYHMLGDIKNLYQYEQFYPYFNNKIIVNDIKKYKGLNWFDYNFPIVRYYGSTKEIIDAINIFLRPSHNIGNRYKGFYNMDINWTGEFEKIKANKRYINQIIDKESLKLFEDYLKDTQRRNIKLIFVYTPEYIEGQRFVANRDKIMNLYKKISVKYKIPLLDYSSDSICFKKEYFYNAEHLNLKGSNLFTKKLATDLKKYIKDSI